MLGKLDPGGKHRNPVNNVTRQVLVGAADVPLDDRTPLHFNRNTHVDHGANMNLHISVMCGSFVWTLNEKLSHSSSLSKRLRLAIWINQRDLVNIRA
jgi:hypothetical protein